MSPDQSGRDDAHRILHVGAQVRVETVKPGSDVSGSIIAIDDRGLSVESESDQGPYFLPWTAILWVQLIK